PHENGATGGAATAYELRFKTAAACASFDSSTFASGTLVPTGAPAVPGTLEHADVSGLPVDEDACFILASADEAANVSYSAKLGLHTLDVVPPAQPVIDSASPYSISVTLSFHAPGDNGSTGTATPYRVAYVNTATTCPATEAGFTNPTILTSPTDLPAPQPAGTVQ